MQRSVCFSFPASLLSTFHSLSFPLKWNTTPFFRFSFHQQLNSWQRRIPSGVSLLLFCRFAVFSQPYKNNDCSSRIKASRLSIPFCSLTDAEQDILTYEAKKIPSQSIRWYILSFFFLLLFCPCRNVKFPPSKPHSTDLYGANIFPFTQWVDGSPLNKSKFLSLPRALLLDGISN